MLSEHHLSVKAPRSLIMFLCICVAAAGCGGSSQRLQQLQNENDRLISEYRAQRDQVSQLNERLATLQNRLAESEKLLARQSPSPSTRLSRLNQNPDSFSGTTNRGIGDKSTNSSATSSKSGAANQSNEAGAGAIGNEELYWRPMRREQPK